MLIIPLVSDPDADLKTFLGVKRDEPYPISEPAFKVERNKSTFKLTGSTGCAWL